MGPPPPAPPWPSLLLLRAPQSAFYVSLLGLKCNPLSLLLQNAPRKDRERKAKILPSQINPSA
jgi:hypothetical protein